MINNKNKIERGKLSGKNSERKILLSILIALLIGIASYFYTESLIGASVVSFILFIMLQAYFFFKKRLKESARRKKIEDVFPDFIELMASNLRAGMTIDKALLLSSRKEFAPLDSEILNLGKDILTGKEINAALLEMSERIKSDKIKKTINVIISGIRSGGNLSILLEETAISMRERSFIEKKASSNVLMYIIFIFFAVAIGAPILFALSSVLVQILTKLLANVPSAAEVSSIPFTLTKINISVNFITYFSLVFLIVTDILSSLVLGITNKGEEKEGLKYIIPLVIVSVSVFIAVRLFMLSYFSGLFG